MEKSSSSKQNEQQFPTNGLIGPAMGTAVAMTAMGTAMAAQAWGMWFGMMTNAMKGSGLPAGSAFDPANVFGSASGGWTDHEKESGALSSSGAPASVKAKAAAETLSAEIERTTAEFQEAGKKIARALTEDMEHAVEQAQDIVRANPLCAPLIPTAKKPSKQIPVAKKAKAENPETKPETTKPSEPAKLHVVENPVAETAVDNLKQISGIGPKLEQVLNKNGVTSFAQIAEWGEGDIKKFDKMFALTGRIERDDWIGQAKKLADKV